MLLSLLLGAAAAAGPVLEPVTKWSVEAQPGLCVFNRSFAVGGVRASFGLRQAPADIQDEIILLTYGERGGVGRTSSVTVTFGPSGKRIEGTNFYSVPVPGTDQRLARFVIPRREMGAFDGAETVTIRETGHPPVTLHVTGVTRALDAVLRCEAQQLADWGVDPSAIATWPKPIGSVVDWFTFPHRALNGTAGTQVGDTTVRWMIDETGRAHDCTVVRSSGDSVLDAAACANIVRRARYSPAIGKDGRPRPWLETRRIVWALDLYH